MKELQKLYENYLLVTNKISNKILISIIIISALNIFQYFRKNMRCMHWAYNALQLHRNSNNKHVRQGHIII